jgi:hypothetical protein
MESCLLKDPKIGVDRRKKQYHDSTMRENQEYNVSKVILPNMEN